MNVCVCVRVLRHSVAHSGTGTRKKSLTHATLQSIPGVAHTHTGAGDCGKGLLEDKKTKHMDILHCITALIAVFTGILILL